MDRCSKADNGSQGRRMTSASPLPLAAAAGSEGLLVEVWTCNQSSVCVLKSTLAVGPDDVWSISVNLTGAAQQQGRQRILPPNQTARSIALFKVLMMPAVAARSCRPAANLHVSVCFMFSFNCRPHQPPAAHQPCYLLVAPCHMPYAYAAKPPSMIVICVRRWHAVCCEQYQSGGSAVCFAGPGLGRVTSRSRNGCRFRFAGHLG